MFKLPQTAVWPQWAPLPLRLIIGYGFMAHGWAKLSRGPEGFAKLLGQIGAPLPEATAWVSTYIEILGGLAMSLVGVEGTPVVAAGVALFIALPVLRVLVMLGAFIRHRDYRLVIVATVVLMTILAGLVIGLSSSSPLAH